MPPDPRLNRSGVVLPVRSFTDGKARLAARLGTDARAQLVRSMADRVADAAGSRVVVVVSDAVDVRRWADERGVTTIADPGSLDAAADAGRAYIAGRGLRRVVIAHADLPFATTFDHVAADDEDRVAVIVP